MAAAEDSKSFGSDTVWVRIPSWPPVEIIGLIPFGVNPFFFA